MGPPAVGAGQALERFASALGREVSSARASAPRRTGARDQRGRRLRASAYRFGPKRGGGRNHRGAGGRRPLATLLIVAAAGTAALTAFLAGTSAYIGFASTLPDVHAIMNADPQQDSLVYAADGSLLADIHVNGLQSYYQPLAQMGTLLPDATVAIEDANFWSESGIDYSRIVQAAYIDWRRHQPVQGASTITQQLVKLKLTGSQVSLERKVREALLAVQLDRTYSKQQILEQYLNAIFYGDNSQGALAAARVYFHKDTKDLDLAQAAMLAGIPQSPYYNSPFYSWDNARARQRQVLDAMVRRGYATQDQADQAYAEDLRPPARMFTPGPQVLGAPAFVGWVVQQLVDRFGQDETYGGGLRVFTTLNPALEAAADSAVRANVAKDAGKGMTQGAMVAIDPRTGAVMAMVGSADPSRNGGQYNMAVTLRNPGSSFKLWTYTAAIASGKYTMVTPVVDSPITVSEPGQSPNYRPPNYDHRYHGVCELQQCLGNSLNIPAVKVEVSTGIQLVVDAARRVGAPPWWQDPVTGTFSADVPAANFGPSLTLGGYGETVLQQATGAATLADSGVYHPPYGVARVTQADGTPLFAADPAAAARQVIDPAVAYIVAAMTSDDSNRAMIFGRGTSLTLPGRRVSAKTGTTDDYTDAWTVGFTPSLAAAAWFGDPKHRPMQAGFDAIYAAAPAWHNFMVAALQQLGAPAGEWLPLPADVVTRDWGGRQIYLLPGTDPRQPAPPLPYWASSPSSTPARPGPQPSPGPTSSPGQSSGN